MTRPGAASKSAMGATRVLAAQMARFVAASDLDTLPLPVIERTIDLSMSAFGAAVLGTHDPIYRTQHDHVRERAAQGEAAVIGGGFTTAPELAAMLNATASHVTEYEDVSWPEGQYTCAIFPALFTLGDALDARGAEVLAACVAGFEVASRPALDLEGAFMQRGFLNAACLGTLGTAAGAARLLGLDEDGIAGTLTLAASTASGVLRQTGSAAHVLEAGYAARNGIEAALLARRGLCGSAGVFDDPRGFFAAHAGAVPEAFAPAPEALRIMAVGQKKYPCGYITQRLIDGLLALTGGQRFDPAQVERVEIHANAAFANYVRFVEPASGEEARLSIHHCIAACLVRGGVDVGAFAPAALGDGAIARLRGKVRLIEHPEWGEAMIGPFERLVLHLEAGETRSIDCRIAHGDADDPLSREETIAKFRVCTAAGARERQDAWIEAIGALASAPSVRPLMRSLGARL